jgi:glycerate kinase
MAAASGLPRVPPDRRDPLRATSEGTGALVRSALDAGFRRMVVGIGGSATNDGGAGFARALGARFLDASGRELPPGGGALARLDRIDLAGMDPRLAECDLLVACDVDNPLTGPRGASAVYGPQKGAGPEDIRALDAALATFAAVAARTTGRDLADLPGAGAAGGLGAGLLWFTPARLRPGVDIVLEVTDFEAKVRDAHLVVTGEGLTDAQTAMGKAPAGVARIARHHGVPVLCLSGGLGEGAEAVLACGVDGLASLVARPMDLEACMAQGAPLLEAAAARVFRLLVLGAALAR